MNGPARLHILRRITQFLFLLLILLLPVFDILRYDTVTKELFIFGKAWSLGLRDAISDGQLVSSTRVALTIILKAIIPWVIILSIFPLLGFFFGRLFCGWLCPEGFLFEFADYLNLKILGRRSLYRTAYNNPSVEASRRGLYIILAVLFYITVPPVIGVFLTGYFIAPATIWKEITTGNLSFGLKAGIAGVSIYLVITSIFVRHLFCKYVCAPGLMQMLFGWFSSRSLRVEFDRANISRCTDCRRCEQVCFMGVMPRAPQKNINCVNCGECISACEKELGRDNGLFSFQRGKKKENESKTSQPVLRHP
jgi:polyferredoxin